MPTPEANGKHDEETWLDWLAPGAPEPAPLMTRDELLANVRRLHEPGIPLKRINERNLRHWEAVGALPRPIVRWHAPSKTSRALYPAWAASLIPLLYRLREAGEDWSEIRRQLREAPRQHVVAAPAAAATGYAPPPTVTIYPSFASDPADLDAALVAYARRHEEVTGARIAEVQVRLADAEGRQRGRYTLAVPADRPDEP